MCYVCAMEEKSERSYAKESTKSSPSGVRFDLEKLAFIQKRENLPTKQKVVDFLLNDYWWKWKVPVATAKEAPPLALKVETVIAPTPQAKVAVSAPKSFLQYQNEKRELECDEDYAKWLAAVNGDPFLSGKQKDLLIKYS